MSRSTRPDPRLAGSLVAVHQRVAGYLEDRLGPVRAEGPDGFSCRKGSTRVYITVLEGVATAEALVHVSAPVALGVTPSEALYGHIGRQSDEFYLGALAVVNRGETVDVIFGHTLIGDHLHRDDLMVTMDLVAATADGLDEQMVIHFGGSLAHEEHATIWLDRDPVSITTVSPSPR